MATLHRTSDLALIQPLLAKSGGTPRTPDTWRHDAMTALVLGTPNAPQAAMPMAIRPIRVSGKKQITVGWLSSNQFPSRMSWRRQTRSTAPDWPTLLPDLDALLVMRREDSPGASWYAHTGFSDVLSIRCLYLDMEAPPASPLATASAAGRYHVQVITPSENQWDPAFWQNQMLSVYSDVHGATGGAMPRHTTFWQGALANHFYREHYQFQIVGLWSAAPAPHASATSPAQTLMGYAVIGWSGWHSKRPRMDILELATRHWDSAIAADLIRTTCQLAWSKSVKQIRAVVSVHDPYRGHLTRMGFADRWGYLLQAKWLHPQRYLDTQSALLPTELGDFWLQLTSPGHVPLVMGRGPRSSPATHLSLQADSGTLTRLLFNRTDISAALHDGTLLPAAPLSDHDTARLSLSFPWTPWIFHMLDYI